MFADLDIIGRFELGWWKITEVAVQSLVVVPVDPGQGGEFEFVDASPKSSTRSSHELDFVEGVDARGSGRS